MSKTDDPSQTTKEDPRPCTIPSDAEMAHFRANMGIDDGLRSEKRRQSHSSAPPGINMIRIEPSAPGIL